MPAAQSFRPSLPDSLPIIDRVGDGKVLLAFGHQHLGVTQGGAADWLSMTWANWLLGNAPGAAVIEITLGGLSLIAQSDCILALAGADLAASVDGKAH